MTYETLKPNTALISQIQARHLIKAIQGYRTELQAEIDFREDLLTTSINAEGYTPEAVKERRAIRQEIKERREENDFQFALVQKLQAIL